MPGLFTHKGYSFARTMPYLMFTTEGIYGISLGTCASFITLFVLFGAFLQNTGGGQFFIDAAFSVAGRFRGGPAKTSVISSLLMGCISGSPIANVVTTGTFTIPLMKKAGYEPETACAIEAVSSTGGMIMPPMFIIFFSQRQWHKRSLFFSRGSNDGNGKKEKIFKCLSVFGILRPIRPI